MPKHHLWNIPCFQWQRKIAMTSYLQAIQLAITDPFLKRHNTSLSLHNPIYLLLKFKYLLPTNSKIKLLPMKAARIPRSRHRLPYSIPNGA